MKKNKIYVALSTILTSAILAFASGTCVYGKTLPATDNNISIQDEDSEQNNSDTLSAEEIEKLLTYRDIDVSVPAVSKPKYVVSADKYLPKLDDISWMPAIRNQNPFGSCWAHTSVGLAEFSILKQEKIEKDFSELHLAYFMYNDSDSDPLGGTEGDTSRLADTSNTYLQAGGNLAYSMVALYGWKGLVDEDTAPYPSGVASTYNVPLDADLEYKYTTAHLRNAYKINIKENPELVKEMVQKYGAAGISYFHDDSKYNSTHNSYNGTGRTDTNHAVMIVGYDDTFPKENFVTPATKDGAWLIRNSWGGSGYSMYGYFWMSYEESSISDAAYVFDFVSSESDEYYDNNYQYDGGCASGSLASKSPLKVANVFTVQHEHEFLEAVSFMTESANVDYTVKIYKNPSDLSKLDYGELVATKSGATTFAGIYNIKLDNAVLLKKDDVYAVVVELSKSDNTEVSISTEYQSHGLPDWFFWSTCSAKEKQSFYFDNVEWFDYGKEYNSNIRIKAYTNNNKPVSLEIKQNPTRLSYKCSDNVLLDGLKVSIALESGDVKEITYSKETANLFSSNLDNKNLTIDDDKLIITIYGLSKEIDINVTHNEVTDEAVSPNCTETGLTKGSHCDRCKDILIAQTEIPALKHIEVIDTGYAASCTKAGLTDGSHCDRCKDILIAQTEIPALKHIEVIDTGYAASCTKAGLTDGSHCDRCKDILIAQTEIPALKHIEVIDTGYAASCTKAGLTDGSHCDRCKDILIAQTEIPALKHIEVIDTGYAASCTKDGLTEGSHCGRCDEVLTAQTVIVAPGHNEVIDANKAPTCTENGLTKGSHCDRCGEVYTAQTVIPALGHIEVVDRGKTVSCTKEGLTDGIHCDRCKEILKEQVTVAPLGHIEVVDKGKAATCTDTGLDDGCHCDRCGEILKKQTVIPALGHNEIIDKAKTPTCTDTGLTEGSHCSRCNEVFETQDIIPEKGHREIVEITKATDQKDGYITTKCSVCKAQLKKTIISHTEIRLSSTSFTYNGKAKQPVLSVYDADGYSIQPANYTITYPDNPVSAGKYYVTVTFKGDFYQGSVKKAFTIKKAAQPLKLSVSKKSYKASALKKAKKTFTIKVTKQQGNVTYKSSNKNITISKNGKVTIKKGIKKGTYTITVKAKGNADYLSESKLVTITIK